jgi:DNA polymerase III subunit beta
MKFVVENEAFAKALAQVKGSIRQSSIPILCHVAVEALPGNQLKIRSCNLERETEVVLPAEVSAQGSAALPGEVLCALSRRLAKGGQSEFAKTSERVKLTSGASSYDFRYLELKDFPISRPIGDDAVRFSLPSSELRKLISSVMYAANAKEQRAYCRGPWLQAQGKRLVALATDSLRMAECAIDLPKGAASMPSIIVPLEACQQIIDVVTDVDEVELAVSSSMLEVRAGSVRLATSLIDGRPIDYKHLIPKREDDPVTVHPYVLSEAVDRAMTVYLGEREPNRRSALTLALGKGAIKLEAGVAGNEQATETIEADTNGHDISFRIDARFLSDALKAFPETATVGVQQEEYGKPVLFWAPQTPEMVHVVMPWVK